MPWAKSFDTDEVLDRATEVFWARGYEAASMSELLAAMRLNKGSLYNTFGSKDGLFLRALQKYDVDRRQVLLRQVEAMEDPVDSISTLFDTLIAESLTDKEKKGCLLVNTALDRPNRSENVRDMVDAALADHEAFFRRIVKRGQKQGTIPDSIRPGQTAKSLLALVVGLRVLSRGVFDASSLRAIRNDALRLLVERPENGPKSRKPHDQGEHAAKNGGSQQISMELLGAEITSAGASSYDD